MASKWCSFDRKTAWKIRYGSLWAKMRWLSSFNQSLSIGIKQASTRPSYLPCTFFISYRSLTPPSVLVFGRLVALAARRWDMVRVIHMQTTIQKDAQTRPNKGIPSRNAIAPMNHPKVVTGKLNRACLVSKIVPLPTSKAIYFLGFFSHCKPVNQYWNLFTAFVTSPQPRVVLYVQTISRAHFFWRASQCFLGDGQQSEGSNMSPLQP